MTRPTPYLSNLRFAYADPPYPGQARRHYADQPVCQEVNHSILIGTLEAHYPDGWALSTSSPALRQVLPLCPPEVRAMAWVKPFASFKPGVNPGYCWEPVLVMGGRKLGREVPTVRDWVSANITLKRGMPGAKPLEFCFWLFRVLGIQAGDSLDDLFPGSGAITQALDIYQRQGRLV